MHSRGISEDYRSRPSPDKHRRRRTLSTVSIPTAGSESKIHVALPARAVPRSAEKDVAVGAFTLAGPSARAALRGLAPNPLALPADPDAEYAYAAYRPPSARAPLPGDSPPASPACSFDSVPAFIRTAPPFFSGDGARRNVKEKAKETPRAQPQTRIHPVLDALERGSRMGTGHMACAACGTLGSNFPRCAKCAQAWCSRECRLSSVHRCSAARRGGAGEPT
ncbi:hypothetical protein FB451DRAFT_1554665 [Mycena latifolia]|nr:hypothetical protein FB451DRAFT_1554665 [Mycena latifolia]